MKEMERTEEVEEESRPVSIVVVTPEVVTPPPFLFVLFFSFVSCFIFLPLPPPLFLLVAIPPHSPLFTSCFIFISPSCISFSGLPPPLSSSSYAPTPCLNLSDSYFTHHPVLLFSPSSSLHPNLLYFSHPSFLTSCSLIFPPPLFPFQLHLSLYFYLSFLPYLLPPLLTFPFHF